MRHETRHRLTGNQLHRLMELAGRNGIARRDFRQRMIHRHGVTPDYLDGVTAQTIIQQLETRAAAEGKSAAEGSPPEVDQHQTRDGLHISISAIKTYLRCPRQFEFRYIRGAEPEFTPLALAFGAAFHGALAKHYMIVRDTGTSPPVEALVQTFVDLWTQKQDGKVPLQAGEDDDGGVDPVDLAAKMLTAFSGQAALPDGVTVAAVEEPFSVPLHDPESGEVIDERLVGTFDLTLRHGQSTTIVEHKSAARKWSADQLEFDLQPTAYRIAMRELGVDDVGLRMQIVTKTKNPAVQIADVTRTSRDEDEFRRVALGVLHAVDAGVSYPVRGWHCRGCPYRTACDQRGV